MRDLVFWTWGVGGAADALATLLGLYSRFVLSTHDATGDVDHADHRDPTPIPGHAGPRTASEAGHSVRPAGLPLRVRGHRLVSRPARERQEYPRPVESRREPGGLARPRGARGRRRCGRRGARRI